MNNGKLLSVGQSVEAKDAGGEQWWPAKILEVDSEGNEVLVHFVKFNNRHDEWIKNDSPRLRKLSIMEEQPEESKQESVSSVSAAESAVSVSAAENNANHPTKKKFKTGDRVMAPWKMGRKYPAIVGKEIENGYIVKFYDGVENKVRAATMRYLRKDEEYKIKLLPKLEQQEANNSSSSSLSRRERKSKFNVKELLNIRNPSSSSSNSSVNNVSNNKKNHLKEEDTKENNQRRRSSGRVNNKKESSTSTTSTSSNNSKKSSKGTPITEADLSFIRPNCKDPLLKDENAILLTGKRERKRKKFWDEEEENTRHKKVANSKISVKEKKQRNNSSSNSIQSQNNKSQNQQQNKKAAPEPVKAEPPTVESDGEKPEQPKSPPKSTKVEPSETVITPKNGNKIRNNSKILEYLLFDMTMDPSLIAKQMVEGKNIPGPGVAIPVDSSNLPDGWEKRVIQRGLGVTKGKWDVFITNPKGKSFRSKTELTRHFDDNKLDYSIESFDFTLDDTLKKLRQIWKQYVIKPNLKPGEKLSSPIPAKISKKFKNNLQQQQLAAAAAAAAAANNAPTTTLIELGEESGFNSDLNNKLGVASETGQGLRCTVNKCGKLFRNDRLLTEHVKHYHRDIARTLNLEDDNSSSSCNLELKRRNSDFLTGGGDTPTTAKRLKTLYPSVTVTTEASYENGKRRRSRNDSTHDDYHRVTPPPTPVGPTGPPTPPIFRMSRRRQNQLKKKMSPILRMNRVEDTPDGKEFLEEFMTFLQNKTRENNAEESSSYPPSDNEMSVTSEHLTVEEVVNCTCKRVEEDGLMIQCDICLCWQHGICLGLDEDDPEVPEKHVCQICKDPPGRRHSCVNIDQDWLKEGKFSHLHSSAEALTSKAAAKRENHFRCLSDLMADLSNLSKVLHSLRMKLAVASSENNSKVFMWSSPWSAKHLVDLPQLSPSNNIKSEVSEEDDASKESDETLPLAEEDKPVNINKSLIKEEEEEEQKSAISGDSHQKEGKIMEMIKKEDEEINKNKEDENSNRVKNNNSVDEDININGFSDSLIPSVSEVQRLLPSIIQAYEAPPPTNSSNFIPEPKRIDKEESRINLIDHIDDLQTEIEKRLSFMEESVDKLEENQPSSKTKAVIQMLMSDLSTARKLMNGL